MKYLLVILSIAIIISCSDEGTNPPEDINGISTITHEIFINEFLAKNDTDIQDEEGDFADWIELYNPQDTAVNIGGMFITDKIDSLVMCQIPDTSPNITSIPPKGYLILWADKETNVGVLHLDMKLSAKGEAIILSKIQGYKHIIVDSLSFPSQNADVSFGRYPDGSDNWEYFLNTTPGAPNVK